MEKYTESSSSNLGCEQDLYFISKPHRLIFALTELDGENRAKILEIKKELYYDKAEAKAWRDRIIKLIHPDVCSISGAEKAVAKLTELYLGMTDDE